MAHKDLQMVTRILNGERETFDTLYDLYFPKVYNYVYMKLQDRAEAEDLVQDVFVSVIESLESYEGRSSLLCWTFSITKNMLKNLYRTRKQNSHFFADAEGQCRNNFPKNVRTPLDQLEYKEFLEKWHDNIGKLPQNSRKIFYLKHFNGLSIKEIARKTDKSEGAVKTALYRTKILLTNKVVPRRSSI